MRSPASIAACNGLRATIATPLPKTVPSARTSNGRQWPTADTIEQFVARIPISDPAAKRTALRALAQRDNVKNAIELEFTGSF